MSEYTKRVLWDFEVEGEDFELQVGPNWIRVKETRCNGQEETHMSGYLVKDNSGKWDWDKNEGGARQFVNYGSQELADAIRDYVNQHGVPSDD